MKVAFIIGPTGLKYQDTYYNKFKLERRNYLKIVPKKYFINDNGKSVSNGDIYVRIDIAVAYYLKGSLKDSLDIIPAENLHAYNLDAYDLIINQFMDLLIVPFMKKYEKNEIPHLKLKEIYEKYSNKIYPSFDYQNLVYDKCKYYAMLKKINIKIADVYCLYKIESHKGVYHKISKDLNVPFFAKPIHGTDSIDIQIIKNESEFNKYRRRIFKNAQYPGIIFQKYVKSFETTSPQVRMYYVGKTHQYSIITFSDGRTYRPDDKSEKYVKGDTYKLGSNVLKDLKSKSKQILDYIQKTYFKSTPMLITRIDFGFFENSKYFVNEIEFNPGLYLHEGGERKFNMDIKISKQLLKVIEIKSRQPKPTVGIFIRPGKDYDDVKTMGKPWLAHTSKESVSPDIALFEYMKHAYSQYIFVKLNRNTFHNVKKPDIVLMGFEDLTMSYMKYVVLKSEKYKFDRFHKALKKCKKLYPNMNMIEFITDKCNYLDWLRLNKFKVADTLCYDLKKYKNHNVTKGIQNWNKMFIKPQPSAESKGILATNKKENVLKHMKV